MDEKKILKSNQTSPPAPPKRRRFLRESLTGSVPLLVDWVTGRAREAYRLVEEPRVARRASPPPEAGDAPPEDAKRTLDDHHAGLDHKNPDPESFSS